MALRSTIRTMEKVAKLKFRCEFRIYGKRICPVPISRNGIGFLLKRRNTAQSAKGGQAGQKVVFAAGETLKSF